jgi:beta-glucosidase
VGYCIRPGKVFVTRVLFAQAISTLAGGMAGNAKVIAAMLALALAAGAASAAEPSVHPERWPSVTPTLPSDGALESRVSALIEVMTLEEKVGQLIQPDIASITPEDLRHFALGSILNGRNYLAEWGRVCVTE